MKAHLEDFRPVTPRPSATASRTEPPFGRAASSRVSVRLPVTQENRAYLQAMRAAELAAWQPLLKARRKAAADADRAQLRTMVSDVSREHRRESWLYAMVACLTALAVGYAVWDFFALFENWTSFGRFVGQLFG